MGLIHRNYFVNGYSFKTQIRTYLKYTDHLNQTTSLWIGIVLTVGSSCLMSLGSLLMKHGISREDIRINHERKTFSNNYSWWLGVFLYSLGSLIHLIGLIFAPASVLAPLNSLGLIANAIGAVIFLHESPTNLEIFSTFISIIGVTICSFSCFLPHDESKILDGTSSWTELLYILYLCFCGCIIVTILIYVNNEEKRIISDQWDQILHKHIEKGHIEYTNDIEITSLNSTLHEQFSDLNTYQNPNSSKSPSYKSEWDRNFNYSYNQIGMLYSIIAGVIGAQCVLQLKETTAFVMRSFDYKNVWSSPQPYLVTLFGLASIVLQMHYLNHSLAYGDAMVTIPTYYVFWTIFGAIGGSVKFHEMSGFSNTQILLFTIGFLLTLLSLALVATIDVAKLKSQRIRELHSKSNKMIELLNSRLNLRFPIMMSLGILSWDKLEKKFEENYESRMILRKTQSFNTLPDNFHKTFLTNNEALGNDILTSKYSKPFLCSLHNPLYNWNCTFNPLMEDLYNKQYDNANDKSTKYNAVKHQDANTTLHKSKTYRENKIFNHQNKLYDVEKINPLSAHQNMYNHYIMQGRV